MALQKIGLVAVLDLKKFNKAFGKYTRSLDTMNSKTTGIARGLSGKFLGLGNSLLKVAGILSGAVLAGVGLVAVGITKLAVGGIRDAADLEQAVAGIAAVLNITSDEAGFLRDVIIDLGVNPDLKVSTFEAAEAMEILAKNGIFAGLSIAEMDTVARQAGLATVLLANATGAEFGQAADIATDAMILFNKDASEMVDIVSGITSVTTNSKFTIHDYELALRNGGAAAAIMGVSLEDFNVAVAASAEELGKGRKAGTGLLNFFNRLTPNSEKAAGIMQDLGFIVDGNNVFFNQATGELKNMSDISQILNEQLFGQVAVVKQVSGRTAEQTEALVQMNEEYRKAEQTIFDYTMGSDSLLASEEEKNKALEEAQGIMAALGPTINELNGITGEYSVSMETLKLEQRSAALETIFGNDAMKTAIALANEGAEANITAGEAMEIFGVNMSEANAMIADGITEWDILQAQMAETDAMKNAETRTDTLAVKWANLQDVFQAIRLEAMEPLRQLLEDILDEQIIPWVEANEHLFESLKDVGQELANFISALIAGEDPMESLLKFLTDVFGTDVAQRFVEIKQSIEDFVKPIISFVDEHSEALIGALKAIAIALGGLMILAVIAGLINFILNPVTLLIAAVGLLGAAWTTNFLGIQDIVESAWQIIKPVVDNIIEGIGNFIAALQAGEGADKLSGVFEKIQQVIAVVQPILEIFVNTIRDSLIEVFQNAAGEMDSFAPVMERLKELWITIQPLVVGLGQVLGGIFAVGLATVIGLFKGLSFAIGTIINTLALVLEGVVQFVQGFVDLIAGLATAIFGWITGNEEMMESGWQRAVDGVTDIVLGLVQAVVSLLLGLGLAIFEFLAGFVTGFVGFFQDLYDKLVGNSIIPDLVNDILEWVVKLIEDSIAAVTEWLTSMLEFFIEKATEILDVIITWVLDMIAEYIDLREKVIEEIKEWWRLLIEKVKEKAAEVVETIKTLVADLIAEIVNAKESFVTAGANIIDGIIDGITGKLADAQAAIMGIASNLKSAWDAFWGNESPSKLMIESGIDIIRGAEIGVMMQAPVLDDVLASAGVNAFGSFVGSVQNILPAGGGAGAITTNNQTTEQNFEVNNSFADQPQITDAGQLRLVLAGLAQ